VSKDIAFRVVDRIVQRSKSSLFEAALVRPELGKNTWFIKSLQNGDVVKSERFYKEANALSRWNELRASVLGAS
jgi:hypothetical protein